MNDVLQRARVVAAQRRAMRRRPTPKHAPRVPFAVLVVGLIVGGMALLLALNTASAANELRRHDLAGRDVGVAAQVQELQNEVAASAAPENLAQAAAELGMVPADNPAFLVIGSDGAVRVLGSPAKASAAPLPAAQGANKHKAKKKAQKTPATTAGHSSKSSAASKSSSPSKSTSASKSSSTTATAAGKTPKPTPTPTPTVTLPGGNR